MTSKALSNVFKLRGIVIPDDPAYGAKGDGTTDDSAGFALAAAAAQGGVLKLTPGKTYLIGAVDIPASANGTVVDMTGATVKLKVLGTNVSSPIFNVTGTGRVRFINGTVDGNKANQPADGFSDSFDGGGSGKGRAFRAGIKADASANPSVSRVEVVGTHFKNTYGAPIATRDIPTVKVTGCYSESCNFELSYSTQVSGTLLDFQFLENTLFSTGSGDATVNANGCLATNYRRVTVSDNHCYNVERNLCKIEGGQNIAVEGNVIDTNTVNNFSGIQLSATSTTPITRAVVAGNTMYTVGCGIQLAVTAGTPNNITISDNNIYTTTGTNTADGIRVDKAASLVVSGNNLYDIKRHGIFMSDGCDRARVNDNVLYGQAGSQTGIYCTASASSFGTVSIDNNHVENFTQSAAGTGVVALERSAAFVYAKAFVRGNTILGGASGNRGLRAAADCITAGVAADNYIDGQVETASAGFLMKNNTVTGTVTLPAAMLSFTPTLLFGGAAVGMTYTTQLGRYRVIDKRVFFEIRIVLSAKGSSVGNATITGLPITAGISGIAIEFACSLVASNLTFTGIPAADISANTATISMVSFATGGALAALADTAFANNTDLRISGSYETAGLSS